MKPVDQYPAYAETRNTVFELRNYFDDTGDVVKKWMVHEQLLLDEGFPFAFTGMSQRYNN